MLALNARFDLEVTLSEELYASLTETRVRSPLAIVEAARRRVRPTSIAPRGRLAILACDHPARRVVAAGGAPLAMADRRDFLARIVRVLAEDAADGVMATADVIEELLLLHELGGRRFLDGKAVIASLNRGGLAGTSWEIDDPVTGPSPRACAAAGLDGVKLLWRVCDDDPRSLETMRACARAIRRANALELPVFLEPLPMAWSGERYALRRDAGALAALVGVASALGDSSRNLWLKLPSCADFTTVARSTTLPILLLGGDTAGDQARVLGELTSALAAGGNVRGTMLGRNILFPDDPLPMARAVHDLVHAVSPAGTTAKEGSP
jgi:DhnA family fructose-bisphosphate aldolase class Ia